MQFKRATKKSARLRMALVGPAGAGKTYSALAIASHLVPGGRVAVIDTEHGSASKYADIFAFDCLELDSFAPRTYVEAIHAAEGYDVIVIDSLSHAWTGKDGALEQVDRKAKASQSSNTFAAWRDVTPQHNAMVESMLACRSHLIVTMRAKTEYVMEQNERGRSVPRKIGLAPVQRDGLDFEFDVVGDVTLEHDTVISKTRCPALADKIFNKAGADVATILRGWLGDGPIEDKTPETPEEIMDLLGLFGSVSTRDEFESLAGSVKPLVAKFPQHREAVVRAYTAARTRVES